MRRLGRVTLVCVATSAIAWLGTTSPAFAQGVAITGAGLIHAGAAETCSNDASGQNAAASIPSCSAFNALPVQSATTATSVAASANNGLLTTKSTSFFDGYNETDAPFTLHTSATSTWDDVLHVTGPVGTQVASVGVGIQADGYYYVTGQADHGSLNPSTGTVSELAFNLELTGNGRVWTEPGLTITEDGRNESPSYQEYGAMTEHPVSVGNIYQEFSFNGSDQISLGWSFTALTEIAFAPTPYQYWYNGEPSTPQVILNANGGLGTLHFFDLNHTDITDQVQYRFDNGASLYTSSTPEPTSLALLGTGLLGLIPMVRRK